MRAKTGIERGDVQGTSPKRGRPVGIGTFVALAVLLVGIGIVAYPTVSNWWNDLHQSQAIDSYVKAVDEMPQEEIDRRLAEAEAYNDALLDKPGRFVMTDEERSEYNRILDIDGSGIMGYIEVPSLHIRYPLRHGTAEDALQVSIGHIEGTSFPVGGTATHAAVSGHRGLPSATLFSDLDDMRPGDRFSVTVLDRTVTYEVDQIRIVDPGDTADLAIDLDGDYMTLVTCTPYAINSHRLLVRGHRTENAAQATASNASRVPTYLVIIAIALPLVVIFLGVSVIMDKRRPTRQEMREALRRMREQKGGSDDESD